MLHRFSHVWLSATSWTVGHQASLPLGLLRQEYWSALPLPLPGDLPDPEIEPTSPESPTLQVGSLPAEPLGKPKLAKYFHSKQRESGPNLTVQFSSVAQSYLTLCDPMDCSMPGLPVHHQLLEFTQTHVHWVSGAIQPPHLLSSPSPPAFNLSQHQGLF